MVFAGGRELLFTSAPFSNEKEENTQAVKTTPHVANRKGATLVPGTVKLLHHKEKGEDELGSGGPPLNKYITAPYQFF